MNFSYCVHKLPKWIDNGTGFWTGQTSIYCGIRIVIKGEGMLGTSTCSSDRRVNFTGGYVIGAGLYDGCKNILVEAHSDAGYYFYGKPAN